MIKIYTVSKGGGMGTGSEFGYAGYAYKIRFEDQDLEPILDSGRERRALERKIAMIASNNALKKLLESKPDITDEIIIYTDSFVLINGFNKKWYEYWRDHDWTKKSGGKVRHPELWIELLKLTNGKKVKFDRYNSEDESIKKDLLKIAKIEQKLDNN